jgi:hypothetical protein
VTGTVSEQEPVLFVSIREMARYFRVGESSIRRAIRKNKSRFQNWRSDPHSAQRA